MEITGTRQLPASRQQVWDALHDAELLAGLIDGCDSLEWTSENTLSGTVAKKIGPLKAAYAIELEIANSTPLTSYTISGEAKSKSQGFATGSALIDLADADDGCEITYTAQVRIGGKIAQLGSRLVKGATSKVIGEFFGKLAETLAPESATEQ